MDFRHGTGNVTVFTSTRDLIKNARKRYGISPSDEEKQLAFNSLNSINLINSISSFNYELIKVNQNSKLENSFNPTLIQETIDSLTTAVKRLNELNAESRESTDKNLSEISKNPTNSDIPNEKSIWQTNPKKALFELVETEAPKNQYHSLKPKAIHERIVMNGIDLATVFRLCEELHSDGVFVKNKAGAYSINKEYLEGGDYQ